MQKHATYFPCLHILKLQQVYTNLGIQTFPTIGKAETYSPCEVCSEHSQAVCWLSTLLPSLACPGTHRCGSCDRRVQPSVWRCSNQAPAAPRVSIPSPRTSPKRPTSGFREHAEDQSQHFKQSQTYPTLPSNHLAIRGKLRLGHSCHTAASVLSRTSLQTRSLQPWDHGMVHMLSLKCFAVSGVAEHPRDARHRSKL